MLIFKMISVSLEIITFPAKKSDIYQPDSRLSNNNNIVTIKNNIEGSPQIKPINSERMYYINHECFLSKLISNVSCYI